MHTTENLQYRNRSQTNRRCEGDEARVAPSRRLDCNAVFSQSISEAKTTSPLQHTSRRRIKSDKADGDNGVEKMVGSKR